MSIVKSVVNSNNSRKLRLIEKVKSILNHKFKNKKISFLGVTFKPNTDDMREASSIPMIKYLNKKKCKITYYDPSGEKNEFKRLKNVEYFNNLSSTTPKEIAKPENPRFIINILNSAKIPRLFFSL